MDSGDLASISVALASLIVAYRALQWTRKRERILLTYTYLNEWRSASMYRSILFVRNHFGDPDKEQSTVTNARSAGLSALSQEEREHLTAVSFMLDYIGTASVADQLDERILLATIGRPVLDLWLICRDIILSERAARPAKKPIGGQRSQLHDIADDQWQAGFEHIAEQARRKGYSRSMRYQTFKG